MDRNLNLYLPVFIAGACSLLVEIAGGRLIAPYVGTGIFTWAAVIGLVLGALSIGYYMGGRWADQHRSADELGKIFLIAAVATLAVPFLFRLIGPLTLPLELAPAALLASSVLIPASLLYGMISPYAIKLAVQKDQEGQVAGSIFALSTMGSIIGVLGTGFLLIPNMQLTHVFILAALAMLVASWLVTRKFQITDTIVFVVLAVFISSLSFAYYPGDILYESDSAYYHITVVDGDYAGQPARLLLLNDALSTGERDGQPAFGYMLVGRIGYLFAGNPQSALVIGTGAGAQVEDLKAIFPEIEVDGIEIDPQVIEAGKRFFSLQEDARTHIIIEDARRYLQTTEHSYDIIVVDVFRGKSIPSHLATVEAVAEMKQHLRPDGVVVVNLISAVEGERSMPFQLIRNAYGANFEHVLALPLHPMEREQVQNIVLIATDKDTSYLEAQLGPALYPEEPSGSPLPTDEWNPLDVYQLR